MLELLESHTPLRRNVTSEEVADATVFLLSDLSRAITGEVVHVDAGAHATIDGMSPRTGHTSRDRLLAPRTSATGGDALGRTQTRVMPVLEHDQGAARRRLLARGRGAASCDEALPVRLPAGRERRRQRRAARLPARRRAHASPTSSTSRWPSATTTPPTSSRPSSASSAVNALAGELGLTADAHAAADDGRRGPAAGRDNLTSAARPGRAARGARAGPGLERASCERRPRVAGAQEHRDGIARYLPPDDGTWARSATTRRRAATRTTAALVCRRSAAGARRHEATASAGTRRCRDSAPRLYGALGEA